MKQFRPMLASPADLNTLRYPVVASAKLDGIRCLITDAGAVTRNLKPLPNQRLFEYLSQPKYKGLDGELVCGPPGAPDVMRATSSAVMTIAGPAPEEGNIKFLVFDDFSHPQLGYLDRALSMTSILNDKVVKPLEQWVLNNSEEVENYERSMLALGYEGIMLRDPDGKYKYGRSTTKEGLLLKVKRFTDAEAMIIGFEERMHNANEAKEDFLGYTKRSSQIAGMVPSNTLGALVVKCNEFEAAFNVGSGFDDSLRLEIWTNRNKYLGKVITFKYQPYGIKDLPRFPVFKGFRSDL